MKAQKGVLACCAYTCNQNNFTIDFFSWYGNDQSVRTDNIAPQNTNDQIKNFQCNAHIYSDKSSNFFPKVHVLLICYFFGGPEISGNFLASLLKQTLKKVEALLLGSQCTMVFSSQIFLKMAEAKELQSNLVNYKAQLQQVD